MFFKCLIVGFSNKFFSVGLNLYIVSNSEILCHVCCFLMKLEKTISRNTIFFGIGAGVV